MNGKWKWKLRSLGHVWLFATPWTSPWNSPGQNIGVGSLSLLQGIFPTQELNPGLLDCRQILYQLSYEESSFYTVSFPYFSFSFTLVCFYFQKYGFVSLPWQFPLDVYKYFSDFFPAVLFLVTQSCPTLSDPVDCSPPSFSVPGGFSRQEYWSALPCPPPGYLPNPKSNHIASRFFTIWVTRETQEYWSG